MSASTSLSARADVGLIGLAVMGRNLALNVEEKGFEVAVYNRTSSLVSEFMSQNRGKKFVGAKTLEGFVKSIKRPRPILLMIKAGSAVDAVIRQLRPFLEKGDIVIDGGNSWFMDTRRRQAELDQFGLHFMGLGVSGGEEGARFGPSLMPGSSAEAYERLRPILEAVAAKTDSGPCVTRVGNDGAGHFVKMVHNGIEYGDMQLIAEAYDVMRRGLGMSAHEVSRVFEEWNRGELESFLIEITAAVLKVEDEATGKPLVDLVLDRAGQKGTGKWTAQVALDLGVPVPTINAAMFGRMVSSMKSERREASRILTGPSPVIGGDLETHVKALEAALYMSKVCSYAQGMSLISAGSIEYGWAVDLKEIARIWKGGCIIRAALLDSIMKAYEKDPTLRNLLVAEEFSRETVARQGPYRQILAAAQMAGIPTPAMSASLAYFDSYRAESLPQNLTQAQRDAFGSHAYERIDDPEAGPFHTDWIEIARQKKK